MAWPANEEVTQTIVTDDFFQTLDTAAERRFWNKLSADKTQSEITSTFTSFGSVPEPKEKSHVLGGGPTQSTIIKDWLVTSTVHEWESEVYMRRLVAETKPDAMREKATQMAHKAQKTMDKAFCTALCSTTALGYDGIALFSASHAETGSNQTNLSTSNITTTTAPTPAEAEAALTLAINALGILQDDQGSPVNEGVDSWIVLCSTGMTYPMNLVTDMGVAHFAIDTSGATGLYRGKVKVISSAYCTDSGATGGNADVFYLIADPAQSMYHPLACCKMVDWQFNNNLGDLHSDEWNRGVGYLRSYAVFNFVPWKWQTIVRHTFT